MTPDRDDRLFFALSDSTRRELLDRLYAQDGQPLSSLTADFPVSRQAVSKHLDVLEEARLILVERRGRSNRYFLNRMPLRQVQSRWLEKFTQTRTRIDCG